MTFKASRYNFAFHASEGASALFNGRTGALLILEGRHSEDLLDLLVQTASIFTRDMFDEATERNLLDGGFIVEEGYNELEEVRERFWNARGATPPILTITATMDCNLGCYYCYEDRSEKKLSTSNIADLKALARSMVEESPLNGAVRRMRTSLC
jgi:uncharacterized protein